MKLAGEWIKDVRDYLRTEGGSLDSTEAVELFGKPAGAATVAKVLSAAARDGRLKREADPVHEVQDSKARPRYWSCEPEARPKKASYFDGIRRVRSVFELAE